MAAMRDFRTRQLGVAGEEWVVDLEREQLHRSGRTDLADSVRWVAREDGDGAGYDIRSFRPDGSDRLIEVKTTNLGARTPFYITRWEIEVSRRSPESYSLYRVHGFARRSAHLRAGRIRGGAGATRPEGLPRHPHLIGRLSALDPHGRSRRMHP